MTDDDDIERDFAGVTLPEYRPPYLEMLRVLQNVLAVIDKIADLIEADR